MERCPIGPTFAFGFAFDFDFAFGLTVSGAGFVDLPERVLVAW
jgi:hypothetical protein